MKTFFIFDLDNCLADDSKRIPLIDWEKDNLDERYRRYHEASPRDTPGNVEVFVNICKGNMTPLIVTARPEQYRKITEQWFLRHFETLPLIAMRPVNDQAPSAMLKPRIVASLTPIGVTPKTVVGAFDDHFGVVEAYRSMGIAAAVMKIHDIDAYAPPFLINRTLQ